jgi:hypothetical protein
LPKIFMVLFKDGDTNFGLVSICFHQTDFGSQHWFPFLLVSQLTLVLNIGFQLLWTICRTSSSDWWFQTNMTFIFHNIY